MRSKLLTGIVSFVAASTLGAAIALAEPATLNGTVSDAMCGANHMGKDPATCTRQCVAHGSDYALVVGARVYTLKTKDTKLRATLDKLAGAKAKVTGEADGTTVNVTAVEAAN
jgi:hypothetical protein